MATEKSKVSTAFKVDDKLEKEFEQALKYELKDEDIERARLLVGVNVASKERELFSEAMPDAIRNWAQGMGDDNPLYTDEGYGFVPYGLKSSRLGYKNRKRIAPFYIKNEMGVWDVAQRLHWDNEWAKAIGNPLAYDYGVMRQC